MTKLTEDMVIARTKTSDLSTVKKFNCWGSDLSDISICRRLINVEVLSLSLNKINTLQHFQNCRNLTELYVRRNEIRDLCELCYLQDLPKLRRLLLSENPAVETAGHLYRATVLRCLPNLEVLDNAAVTPDEVEAAMKTGLILEHPEQSSRRERIPSPETVYYERESPPPPPSQRKSQYEYRDESPPPYRNQNHGSSSSPEYNYSQNNGNKSPDQGILPISNGHAMSGQRSPPNSAAADDSGISGSQSPAATASPGSASARRQSGSPVYEYYQNSRDQSNGSRRQSADYTVDYRNYENYYDEQSNHRQSTVPIIPTQRHPPLPPSQMRNKPRTKTSNLLSAVLCLIPELDWGSLEVIELAVRRRMDEIINN